MKMINTVCGPIAASDLGPVLMHEHFLFGFCGFQGDTTLGSFQKEANLQSNITAVERAKAYGIHTVIDATTNECGRDPLFLKELSDRTGIHILCSTGYYHELESAFAYWKFRSSFTDIEQEIYEMFLAETTHGIGDTGICAGVIKLASSQGQITPMEQVFFRAAARASQNADVPIITHTQGGTMGPEQATLLIQNGAQPHRIAIGHMCGNTDVSYHEAVLSQGVFDAFDRFGLEGELFHTPTDEERVSLLAELIRRGWEDQLLISHDSVTVELGRPRPVPKESLPFMAHAHIGNIGERIIPMLKAQGITETQLHKLLVENPARLLG